MHNYSGDFKKFKGSDEVPVEPVDGNIVVTVPAPVALTTEVVPFEDPVEEVEDEPVEEIVEETYDEIEIEETVAPASETYVRVNVPPTAKLQVRQNPVVDGEVVGAVSDGTLLEVLDDSNPEWMFVEALGDAGPVQGYVKKAFVVTETAPTLANE